MAQRQREQSDHATEHDAATRLLTQRGWALVPADQLATRAVRLRAANPDIPPASAVLHCYASTLHDACAGHAGLHQQQRGFEELHHYLYDVLRQLAPELAPDGRAEVTDQTVAALYERLMRHHEAVRDTAVRNPGAFLAVAVQQLRNTVRRWRRNMLINVDAWISIPAAYADEPEQQVAVREWQQRVRQCFVHSLRDHPRAKLQLQVVWMRYIVGLDYVAIGAELATSPANVRVLHSRGLRVLRADPAWRDLGTEMGVVAAACDHTSLLHP